jgi:hypothetical protein
MNAKIGIVNGPGSGIVNGKICHRERRVTAFADGEG